MLGNYLEKYLEVFPDSSVTKKIYLWMFKCAYGILFGIYPHLRDSLFQEISKSPLYALPFDGSYNKVLHFDEMDFQVRNRDNDLKQVKTGYLSSRFCRQQRLKVYTRSLMLCCQI